MFRSRCDTEVLPHLYERYGDGFPAQLRGMFGVAVWDERERRAVLARDRLGIKPLYYARSGDVLVFASELKSLLASGLVDPARLRGDRRLPYASGYFPGPRTPLEGVSKLMPGHVLVVGNGRCRTERYWQYPEPRVAPGYVRPSTDERLLEKLDESVQPAADERRAARRHAERRPRFERDRRHSWPGTWPSR